MTETFAIFLEPEFLAKPSRPENPGPSRFYVVLSVADPGFLVGGGSTDTVGGRGTDTVVAGGGGRYPPTWHFLAEMYAKMKYRIPSNFSHQVLRPIFEGALHLEIS